MGFKLPTVDVDTIKVQYSDPFMLMEELQGESCAWKMEPGRRRHAWARRHDTSSCWTLGMGEGNASTQRRDRTSKDTFMAAASLYQHLAMTENPHESAELHQCPIDATFQVT